MVQAVHEEIETVHLYVVREDEPRPVTALPLLLAAFCLLIIGAVTLYSGVNPSYEHTTLTVPAQFFTSTARVTRPVIPTGTTVYPATTAHGTLTITNGSVVSQYLPGGLIFASSDGTEVVTDTGVFVPAGNANGYGSAIVRAHALIAGAFGNIATLAINSVYGTVLYIRDLDAFTGGSDSQTVKVVTNQDVRTATTAAKLAATEAATMAALQFHPCRETAITAMASVTVTATCQYVHFPHVGVLSSCITGIRLRGSDLLIDVTVPPSLTRLPMR